MSQPASNAVALVTSSPGPHGFSALKRASEKRSKLKRRGAERRLAIVHAVRTALIKHLKIKVISSSPSSGQWKIYMILLHYFDKFQRLRRRPTYTLVSENSTQFATFRCLTVLALCTKVHENGRHQTVPFGILAGSDSAQGQGNNVGRTSNDVIQDARVPNARYMGYSPHFEQCKMCHCTAGPKTHQSDQPARAWPQ